MGPSTGSASWPTRCDSRKDLRLKPGQPVAVLRKALVTPALVLLASAAAVCRHGRRPTALVIVGPSGRTPTQATGIHCSLAPGPRRPSLAQSLSADLNDCPAPPGP
eukprot:scaffold3423_cov379-Prasinococcus_capsulatus_cf.AAC.4